MVGLEIRKMPEGGYLVADIYHDMGNRILPFMFAATTIDEALKFVKSKLEPKPTR